jgi:hypothetical protein
MAGAAQRARGEQRQVRAPQRDSSRSTERAKRGVVNGTLAGLRPLMRWMIRRHETDAQELHAKVVAICFDLSEARVTFCRQYEPHADGI